MNSGQTSERAYDTLRRHILTRAFRPGDRLEPAPLAEALGSSVTPVRDALHVLAGEGLVERRTSDGFHLPQITEPELADLYRWNADLLQLAIRGWEYPGDPIVLGMPASEPADTIAHLFDRIVSHSDNLEHRRAIKAASARLHPARMVEPILFADIEAEITDLAETCARGDVAALRRGITAYHRRRRRAAAELVRRLYRHE
jgi:DNA-binding transcriptional MocR family regulator